MPSAASPAGSAGGASWAFTQRSKISGVSTMTRSIMLACEVPQYSAHCPQYVPGVSAVKVILFSRPGMTSRLAAICGTQKLWITSQPTSLMATGRPAGTCNSFAVTTPRLG